MYPFPRPQRQHRRTFRVEYFGCVSERFDLITCALVAIDRYITPIALPADASSWCVPADRPL